MSPSRDSDEVQRKADRVLRARARRDPLWRHLGHVGVLGWVLILPVLLGLLLGHLASVRLGTRVPALLGLLAGLAAGIYGAARQVRGALREDEEDPR